MYFYWLITFYALVFTPFDIFLYEVWYHLIVSIKLTKFGCITEMWIQQRYLGVNDTVAKTLWQKMFLFPICSYKINAQVVVSFVSTERLFMLRLLCVSDHKTSSAELPPGAVQGETAGSRSDPAGCLKCQRGESTDALILYSSTPCFPLFSSCKEVSLLRY